VPSCPAWPLSFKVEFQREVENWPSRRSRLEITTLLYHLGQDWGQERFKLNPAPQIGLLETDFPGNRGNGGAAVIDRGSFDLGKSSGDQENDISAPLMEILPLGYEQLP
jgi:hypothetical protein